MTMARGRRWQAVLAAVSPAVLVAAAAVAATTAGGAPGARPPAVAAAAAGAPATAPRILDVRYAPRHPLGARVRPAIVVRAHDPDGQLISTQVTVGGRTGHADGGCGLGGQVNGDVGRQVHPVPRLAPGRHRVEVVAESSPCTGAAAGHERATRTVVLDVPPRGRAPDTGRIAPPPAWVAARSGARWMAFGSYCWTAPAADGSASGMCVDTVDPASREDLPTLTVRRGELIRFHLGFAPADVELLLPGGRTVALRATADPVWKVAGRPRTVVLVARPAAGGDASYAIRLRVRRGDA